MVTLTPFAIETMLSDKVFYDAIKTFEEEFKSGKKSALLGAVWWCACFQAVMPDWVVMGIAETVAKLENGEHKDFNEAFGFEGISENQRTRKKKANIKRNQKAVMAAYHEMRIRGEALDQATIETIGDNLGISPRQVKNVLDEFKDQINKIPRGPLPENAHMGLINLTIPMFKRVGREPLRENGEKEYRLLWEPPQSQ